MENELNSPHQIYLYDYLYEQQDIFEFYYQQISNRTFDDNSKLKSRKEKLLFSDSLIQYNIFTELDNDDMEILEYIRFYNLPNEKFQFLNLSYEQMNNKCNNFEENFKEFYQEIFQKRIKNKEGNPLITLLLTFYLSITFFCMFTYLEIINSKNSDFLLLDNFIKRYKSFVDGSIYINNNLENLNVIINLIYEKLFNGSESIEPKFSIYRLMLILYNRLVINPFTDETQNNNIIKITSNIYDIYLKEELRKIDLENNKMQFNKSINQILRNSLSSTNDNSYGNYEDLINNLYSLSDLNDFDNFDADFQISQFLENIPSILLDSICDEYSVFYINSTIFPISGNYKKLQDSFIQITINNFNQFNIICNYKFIDFLKENELMNEKFINITKLNICKYIYKQIMDQCFKELENLESSLNDEEINYLKNNQFDFYKCIFNFFFKL